MGCNVERVLGEIGQSLRPMNEAPRDGRGILGKTASGKAAAGLVPVVTTVRVSASSPLPTVTGVPGANIQ